MSEERTNCLEPSSSDFQTVRIAKGACPECGSLLVAVEEYDYCPRYKGCDYKRFHQNKIIPLK